MEHLLARIREGDRTALGVLYDTLFESLWRLALLRTQSADTAEEIVHDVFLSLWMRRETLRPDIDIRVYLAVAVRNRTRNLRAHAQVVQATEDAVSNEILTPPGMGQSFPSADSELEADEFWKAYRSVLSTLTDREREAALLRWEEGFTFEQIAEVLGLSIVGARGVVMRAQNKVQAALAEYR
jgi:RNA polymerase sigma factor (sigma-70 family)